jgi:hypothetical protein
MKNLVYECNMDVCEELLHHTIDAATFISDHETLHHITHSVVKWVKICTEAKCGHFKHLLHQ